MFETTRISTSEYLKKIGVAQLPPCTSPFDPGYDPATLESHLEQSSHLMSILKVSMACWMVAKESATRQKVAAAKRHQVPTVTGGGPFEIAVAQGQLPAYLDLCAELGFTRIECGEGFTDMRWKPKTSCKWRASEALRCSSSSQETRRQLYRRGRAVSGRAGPAMARCWALQLVVEGRESAKGVGLFDDQGNLIAPLQIGSSRHSDSRR